jgi:hypothetical protein
VHLSPAHATNEPTSIGTLDVVLFCAKLWGVESAGAAIRPLIGPNAAGIPLQNGIMVAAYLWARSEMAHMLLFPSLQEEPAMGKRLGKSEKLDLILSKLSELKADVRKLLKNQAAVADRSDKTGSRAARTSRPNKAMKRTVAVRKPARGVASPKPVLVEVPQTEQTPQPSSRTA